MKVELGKPAGRRHNRRQSKSHHGTETAMHQEEDALDGWFDQAVIAVADLAWRFGVSPGWIVALGAPRHWLRRRGW